MRTEGANKSSTVFVSGCNTTYDSGQEIFTWEKQSIEDENGDGLIKSKNNDYVHWNLVHSKTINIAQFGVTAEGDSGNNTNFRMRKFDVGEFTHLYIPNSQYIYAVAIKVKSTGGDVLDIIF